jgi:hypothetical protein
MASLQTSAGDLFDGAGSTGQTLPGGSASTGTRSIAPSLTQSSPSSQFAGSALAYLTLLQDPRSAAAAAVQSTASIALTHASSGLSSALDTLSNALNGSASSASAAANTLTGWATTASAAAAHFSLATSSTLLQSLDALKSALASAGAHHHRGGGVLATSSAAAAALASLTGSVAPGALT